MATLRLPRQRWEKDDLPPICMRCGAASTNRIRKTFSWSPSWIYVLVLVGLLPFVIVALILTKRRTLHVPLCDEHRNHWSWRALVFGLGFLVLVVVGILGFALTTEPNPLNKQIRGITVLILFVGGLAWLILAAVLQNSAIRATHITDRDMTLVKVAPEFVQAVRGRRGGYDEDDEDDDIPCVDAVEDPEREFTPCSSCGELIRAEAKRCRFCGELVD